MKKILVASFFVSAITLGSLAGASLVRAAFNQTLTYGAYGTGVADIQSFLTRQGLYRGPVSGNFGPLTLGAVKAFQAREGITPVNGVFGPKTRARANSLLARTSQPNLEAQIAALMAQVRALEAKLNPSSSTSASADIPAGAIVGVNCYFQYLPTGQVFNLGKGSGAIVSPDGYILTARHLVDPKFSYSVDPTSMPASFALHSTFDHCDVGQAPAGTVLPPPVLIRAFNPSTQVPLLAYRASLTFVPAEVAGSPEEKDSLDFALLKVSGLSDSGAQFNAEVPKTFPHVPLLTANTLAQGDEVVTYGYPGDITEAKQSAFTTFYLAGGVGRVKEVLYGNQSFKNVPVTINTNMEVRSGRSGSPLFYQGKLAGVVTAHAVENVADSYSVSAQAILAVLRQAGVSL